MWRWRRRRRSSSPVTCATTAWEILRFPRKALISSFTMLLSLLPNTEHRPSVWSWSEHAVFTWLYCSSLHVGRCHQAQTFPLCTRWFACHTYRCIEIGAIHSKARNKTSSSGRAILIPGAFWQHLSLYCSVPFFLFLFFFKASTQSALHFCRAQRHPAAWI